MQISVIIAALFASAALAVPAVTVNEAAAIFDRAVNADRPIAEGACCIAGKNKKGGKCENKGKAGVCAVADTAGCKCPFALQDLVAVQMLICIVGNKALTCV
jgi:hypothetical protein